MALLLCGSESAAAGGNDPRWTHADCDRLAHAHADDLPQFASRLADTEAQLSSIAATLQARLDEWHHRLEEARSYSPEQVLAYNTWLWETVGSNLKNANALASTKGPTDALRVLAKILGPRDRKDMVQHARSMQNFSAALSTVLKRWTGVDKLLKLSEHVDAQREQTLRQSKRFIIETKAALRSVLRAHHAAAVDRERLEAYARQIAEALKRDCAWKQNTDDSTGTCKTGVERCERSSECCSGCCNGYFNMCGNPAPCEHDANKRCCPI